MLAGSAKNDTVDELFIVLWKFTCINLYHGPTSEHSKGSSLHNHFCLIELNMMRKNSNVCFHEAFTKTNIKGTNVGN
jgi:hypothetical protein